MNHRSDEDLALDAPLPATADVQGAVRDYLQALLTTLWREEEGFDGKRPFGNSGWQYDVYAALIAAGALDGELDEDGYVEEIDRAAARRLVLNLIRYSFTQG